MEQCDEREKTQVNNLHLGRDLSRVSDFVLKLKKIRVERRSPMTFITAITM
jgi:hypothetical protein